ncbi:MAG: hypothetical protein JRJ09_16790 [Deltaproteobacteria bacterium]|nr:hypothetical protein [Deltaproteobacteria bacterium]MBW2050166.1 hypothetical protein [Deltaproteobacteria bacterium]MBW2110537.1 hypothetical protein [Deltaproteobacteria bacterium]MBW2353673.1 hypothetical protein [Deltaproteobacteria bacterium]HDZ89721.1 hypothetical protein [Deltaproteobacteria bacterium]
MDQKHLYSTGWRDSTKRFEKGLSLRRLVRNRYLMASAAGSILMALFLVFYGVPWTPGRINRVPGAHSEGEGPARSPAWASVSGQASVTPGDLDLDPTRISDRFLLTREGASLLVESTLDPDLQGYLVRVLQNSLNLKAAAVVLRPDDGRILAMASFHQDQDGGDLCLRADFPAASLFKIVSAAAAFEYAGFTPEKTVYFNGRKHTLYKSQLKQRIGRYTSSISFKRAFASSINPVFGKLGIYDLGQKAILDSAERFLFNRPIPFDLPVAMSVVQVPGDDFGLAEIATGFNKETTISPLHAAMLASAVVNRGVMMKPYIIKRISLENGRVLYTNTPGETIRSINPNTAAKLKVLMKATVTHGTCRKCFRGLRRKKAYRNVELGAKTGTINDRSDRFKYDWFTAYMIPSSGKGGICVAVLGIHGKKLGIRANRLGRSIIDHFLRSPSHPASAS